MKSIITLALLLVTASVFGQTTVAPTNKMGSPGAVAPTNSMGNPGNVNTGTVNPSNSIRPNNSTNLNTSGTISGSPTCTSSSGVVLNTRDTGYSDCTRNMGTIK